MKWIAQKLNANKRKIIYFAIPISLFYIFILLFIIDLSNPSERKIFNYSLIWNSSNGLLYKKILMRIGNNYIPIFSTKSNHIKLMFKKYHVELPGISSELLIYQKPLLGNGKIMHTTTPASDIVIRFPLLFERYPKNKQKEELLTYAVASLKQGDRTLDLEKIAEIDPELYNEYRLCH